LRDITLRRESNWDAVLTPNFLGKCFFQIQFSRNSTKWAQTLLKLSADFFILPTYTSFFRHADRAQDLWGYGVVPLDFKGRTVNLGHWYQTQVRFLTVNPCKIKSKLYNSNTMTKNKPFLEGATEKGMLEAMRVKLPWRP
jgi:hypothetical protein